MPQTKFQRVLFAFITVCLTVSAYLFYSLYVVNGETLMMELGTTRVIDAIHQMGGVSIFGQILPIWCVWVIEFCFAFALENLVGSPVSLKIAFKYVDPATTKPMLIEMIIIAATVTIMCPAMSFIAAWMYYPYYNGFYITTLLANWLKLICYNLPFAYFSQLFFIQPAVRTIFKALLKKQSRG